MNSDSISIMIAIISVLAVVIVGFFAIRYYRTNTKSIETSTRNAESQKMKETEKSIIESFIKTLKENNEKADARIGEIKTTILQSNEDNKEQHTQITKDIRELFERQNGFALGTTEKIGEINGRLTRLETAKELDKV